MTKRERTERKEEETEVSACLGAAAWPPGCHCGLVPRRARPLGPPPRPQAPSGRSGRRRAEGTRPAAAVLCPCGRAPPPWPAPASAGSGLRAPAGSGAPGRGPALAGPAQPRVVGGSAPALARAGRPSSSPPAFAFSCVFPPSRRSRPTAFVHWSVELTDFWWSWSAALGRGKHVVGAVGGPQGPRRARAGAGDGAGHRGEGGGRAAPGASRGARVSLIFPTCRPRGLAGAAGGPPGTSLSFGGGLCGPLSGCVSSGAL